MDDVPGKLLVIVLPKAQTYNLIAKYGTLEENLIPREKTKFQRGNS